MRLVVDANIFVGELLRKRGKDLVENKSLTLVVSQSASEEARHEIPKRFAAMVAHMGMSRETAEKLLEEISEASRKVRVMPEEVYRDRLEEARERIPRDPDDAQPSLWRSRSEATKNEREYGRWTGISSDAACQSGRRKLCKRGCPA